MNKNFYVESSRPIIPSSTGEQPDQHDDDYDDDDDEASETEQDEMLTPLVEGGVPRSTTTPARWTSSCSSRVICKNPSWTSSPYEDEYADYTGETEDRLEEEDRSSFIPSSCPSRACERGRRAGAPARPRAMASTNPLHNRRGRPAPRREKMHQEVKTSTLGVEEVHLPAADRVVQEPARGAPSSTKGSVHQMEPTRPPTTSISNGSTTKKPASSTSAYQSATERMKILFKTGSEKLTLILRSSDDSSSSCNYTDDHASWIMNTSDEDDEEELLLINKRLGKLNKK
ncbi:unnamed protein product [Amoebophrya sp. A120]|nr:unnamed protein product [Amoebophrya sp. A120]|eukprot:GSA120T00010064001.1